MTTTPIVDSVLSSEPKQVQLLVKTASGRWLKVPVMIRRAEPAAGRCARIEFPFSDRLVKDEIKSMTGSRWHGDDEQPYWSVEDSPRNRFQLEFLLGGNPYKWFEQAIGDQRYDRPLMKHQREAADHFLTYRFGILAAEMGTGKTLILQEVMEQSTVREWIWVGPKSSIINIRREFLRWNLSPLLVVHMMSYEEFAKHEEQTRDEKPVAGLIFDEASKLKNPVTKRSRAAQRYADRIRATYGHEGYVILATGTPSPKSPADWFSLCEISYPGFLREGSRKALEDRLGIFQEKDFLAGPFKQRTGWRDSADKCSACGAPKEDDIHQAPIEDYDVDPSGTPKKWHEFRAAKNEVAYLYDRLKGLVFIRLKKDVLSELPEKTYRTIYCKPSASVLRYAKLITDSTPSDKAMVALTKLRELSDGFQYVEEESGETKCSDCDNGLVENGMTSCGTLLHTDCATCKGTGQVPRMVRRTEEIVCPKDAALSELLEENDEIGRLVIFGGFDGTLDRIQRVCHKSGWTVVRCDGKGLRAFDSNGMSVDYTAPFDVWTDLVNQPRVAWVANPESGGMSWTLIEARMAVYYSNTFKPEYRSQSEDRIHRKGMDENKGCVIVDLIHLPVDEKVVTTLKENRRLEKMTLGEVAEALAIAA